jgi:hypothetical protein
MRVYVTALIVGGALSGGLLYRSATNRVQQAGRSPAPATPEEPVCSAGVRVVRRAGTLTRLTRSADGGAEGPPVDPAEPSYDAVALQIGGVDAFDIFDAEPVDPQWGPPMQTRIAEQLQKDFRILVPEAEKITVDCHWASCKLSADVDASSRDKPRYAFTVAQYGDRTFFSRRGDEPLEGGKRRFSAIVLFHEERDLATQASVYAQKRHAFFAHMSKENAIYGLLARKGE